MLAGRNETRTWRLIPAGPEAARLQAAEPGAMLDLGRAGDATRFLLGRHQRLPSSGMVIL